LTYILEEIEKNKDVTIKVLRYSDSDLSQIDLTIFNAFELSEFNSFKSIKRQLEYYYARLLWQSFGHQEFVKYKPTGKPILNVGFISISHSHHQVAIAYSKTKEIGMDIEQKSTKVQIVKSKYLHPEENHESITDLTKIWTIKEAIYKLYDSKNLFFKEHIIVKSLLPVQTVFTEVNTVSVYPKIITIELKNNFILSYAQQF